MRWLPRCAPTCLSVAELVEIPAAIRRPGVLRVHEFLVDNGRRRAGLKLICGVHFLHYGVVSTDQFSTGVRKMTRIDWDWQAQLATCQKRIVELEEKIASERRKLRRLLDGNLNATFAQRILAMREESLERVQSCKRLIETRIADREVDRRVEMQ
jgi:hypothetical protein